MSYLHPFENHVIVRNLFEYCDWDNLATCRQVSKLWRVSSMDTWSSKSCVLITKRNISDYVNFVKNSIFDGTCKLYRDYRFGGTTATRQFWRICGSHIKILSMVDCIFPTVADFRNVVFKCCPNIQRLTLVQVSTGKRKSELEPTSDVEEPLEWTQLKFGVNRNLKFLRIQRRSGYLRVSWMELFSHFPSVEILHLFGSDISDNSLFEVINKIRQKNPDNLKFKELLALNTNCTSSAPTISPQLVSLVSDPNLPLESLSFGTNGHDGAFCLWDILHAQSNTLKKLEMYRDVKFALLSPHQCFPALGKKPLENLQEIKLHSRVFTSLSFLEAAPNLEKLAIRNNDWNYSSGDLDNNIIANTLIVSDFISIRLVKCTDFQVAIPTSQRELAELAKWLPNVTKLSISHLSNAKFSTVCQHWPQLVDLVITESEVDELGITGLDENYVRNLDLECEHLWSKDTINIPRTTANVTNLKDLERFSMSALTPMTPLHYCAAVYGFEALPKLRHFSICDYKENSQCQWYMWRQRMLTDRNIDFEMYHDL